MITLIIGNAGSGKSTYLNSLRKDDLLLENIYQENYYDYLTKKLSLGRILIDDMIDYLSYGELLDFIKLARSKNIDLIVTSTNSELMLMVDKIIVIHNQNKILEGSCYEVLSESRLFNNLGINLPFVVQLSNELKDYGMISNICYTNESLVEALWK